MAYGGLTLARIPFNRPLQLGKEFEYMQQALDAGHISGDGQFTKKCHGLLQEMLNVPKALLTTSCTHALEMSALLINIQPGDEVIIPSFTFVSTVNAFVLRGAKPAFVDIRGDTLNLNEKLIPESITSKTKAIAVVHYAGVGCEMDAILEIAQQHDLEVIEDNAHGLFGKYKGKYLGTFGAMAAQSFHETKNITSGEGGALLINDPQYIERAEIIREKGTDRSRFFRGEIDKYTWVDLGSSYLPADTQAAYLYAQLEAYEIIQTKRRQIWEEYDEQLKDWATENAVIQPTIPEHCEQPYHMYYLIMPSLEHRTGLIKHLREREIHAVFHYLPLHLSEMGRQFGGKAGDCPVTEDISDRMLRLPFYYDLGMKDQERVIDAVTSFKM